MDDASSDERWREARRAAALVRCFERGDVLPADPNGSGFEPLADLGRELVERGLFADVGGPFLVPTDEGRAAWRRLSARLDGVRALDVLALVNLTVELDEDVSDDGAFVREGVPDPRFQPPSSTEEAEHAGTEDVRFAVLGYLSGVARERDDDGWRLTLLLSLADGRLTGETAWFDLAHGLGQGELEERGRGAYHARDVSDDPAVIDDVLRHIYEAGVAEVRRRTGALPRCLACAGAAPTTSLWCPPCEEAWLASLSSPLA